MERRPHIVRVLNVYTDKMYDVRALIDILTPKIETVRLETDSTDRVIVVCATLDAEKPNDVSKDVVYTWYDVGDRKREHSLINTNNDKKATIAGDIFYLQRTSNNISDSRDDSVDGPLLNEISRQIPSVRRAEVERLTLSCCNSSTSVMVNTFINSAGSRWDVNDRENILFHGRPVRTIYAKFGDDDDDDDDDDDNYDDDGKFKKPEPEEHVLPMTSKDRRSSYQKGRSNVTRFYKNVRSFWIGVFCAFYRFFLSAIILYCETLSGVYERLPAFRVFGFNLLGCGGARVSRANVNYSVYTALKIGFPYVNVVTDYANRRPVSIKGLTTFDYEYKVGPAKSTNVTDSGMIWGYTSTSSRKRQSTPKLADPTFWGTLRDLALSPITLMGIFFELLVVFWMGAFNTFSGAFLKRFFQLAGLHGLSDLTVDITRGFGSLTGIKNTGFEWLFDNAHLLVSFDTLSAVFLWSAMYFASIYVITRCVRFVKTKRMNAQTITTISNGKFRRKYDLFLLLLFVFTCYGAHYIFTFKCVIKLTITVWRTLRFCHDLLTGKLSFRMVHYTQIGQ